MNGIAAKQQLGPTPRMKQIALLVAEGLCDKEIADRLGIAPMTVKNQLTDMGARLHLNPGPNRRVLITRWAIRNKLVEA